MFQSDTEKFLVGHPQVKVTGAKLPTAGQTLRVFFHRQMCKEIGCECQIPDMSKWTSLSDLTYLVVQDNILPSWGKAGIPTMSLQYAKEKLLKLHSKWKTLNKLRKRMSPVNIKQRQEFQLDLEKLFDLAAPDAKIQIQLDLKLRGKQACDIACEFLDDQRGARKMVMDSEDKRYMKAVEKKIKRKEEEEARKKKECKRQDTEQKMLSISNNGDSSEESDVGKIDKNFVVSEKRRKILKLSQ